MNTSQFRQMLFAHRDALTEKIKEALSYQDYESAADLNAPSNIVQSYIYGFQDVSDYYRNNVPVFNQTAKNAIQFMKDWAGDIQNKYFDYRDIVKNPEFKITINDVYKIYKYSSDFSMLDFTKDLLKTIGNEFLHARRDVHKAAEYFDELISFENDVEMNVGRNLYQALKEDIG
jgi:hypothetical protein